MDSSLMDLADKAIRYAIDSGAQYCDARAEQQERKSVLIENGEIEHVRTNSDIGIGIKLVKDGTWSFCSITNPNSFEQIKEVVNDSLRNSLHYAKNKKNKINLYPNSINKTKIDFPVLKKPELEE
ncbi:MAG: TldD/PmbA family protein, partial [Thaumarchaeota archaeon]|nr:TldD/PmbA family protein [Nitrososphaerota archaeon]